MLNLVKCHNHISQALTRNVIIVQQHCIFVIILKPTFFTHNLSVLVITKIQWNTSTVEAHYNLFHKALGLLKVNKIPRKTLTKQDASKRNIQEIKHYCITNPENILVVYVVVFFVCSTNKDQYYYCVERVKKTFVMFK